VPGIGAGTVVAMVSDHRSRIRTPTATLGAGGPVVSRIGLGLAALGRPAYITSGREEDLPDRSVAGLRTRTFSMLDRAYAAGVRYVDAARSYGRAEEFLAGWLAERGHADVIAGSKWGYRYTGGWRLDAPAQEVKEHSLAMFTTQLAQSRALLGDRLTLYQVHSLTLDSGLFTDAALLAALSRLRAGGVIIGLSASGPHQAETIRRALSVTVDGQQLFTAAEVTWNLLEPSAGAAAADLPAEVTRAGSIMNVHLDGPDQLANLHLALLLEGVYTTPRGMINLSTALSPADLEQVGLAYDRAFTAVRSSA